MLPVTSSTSCHHLPQSPLAQEHGDIAKKIDIINNKLNVSNVSTSDLLFFKNFWGEHKDKLMSSPEKKDKLNETLKSVMDTINSIKDNIESGDNNDENYRKLNVHMIDIKQAAQKEESEINTRERIEKEISRSNEKVKKETSRISEKADKEISRTADNAKKALKRFGRKF